MNPVTVAALLNWFLLPALVLTAPTSNRHALTQAVAETKTVVEKVREDVRASFAATVTLQGATLSTDLELMRERLNISRPPVIKPLSEAFPLDQCLTRHLEGVQLHQDLLTALSAKLLGLRHLNSDIRDLKLRVNKMRKVWQLSGASGSEQNSGSDLASRLDSDYNIHTALRLTLTQLQSFCNDMSRSLDNIEEEYGLTAGSH